MVGAQCVIAVTLVGGGRMGLPLVYSFIGRGASVAICDINWQFVRSMDVGKCS